MGTLANSLTDQATDIVKRQFVGELEKMVKAAASRVDTIKGDLDTITRTHAEAVADHKAKVDALEAIKKVFNLNRGRLLYFASRTRKDGAGHFVELFADGSSTCSCEAGKYHGTCWAQTWAKKNAQSRTPDNSFNYLNKNNGRGGYTNTESFDRREKPYISPYGGFTFIPSGVQRWWTR